MPRPMSLRARSRNRLPVIVSVFAWMSSCSRACSTDAGVVAAVSVNTCDDCLEARRGGSGSMGSAADPKTGMSWPRFFFLDDLDDGFRRFAMLQGVEINGVRFQAGGTKRKREDAMS